MPRHARLDFSGAFNHVIGRGIARQRIFDDSRDYTVFLDTFGELLVRAEAQCLAWALLPNHFHLLIRTGTRPLKWLMQHLLVRYAMYYNRRHHRVGHLFQNRYKSILCEEDVYCKELTRYIHLNPLRARQVAELSSLAGYRWCGHGALLGIRKVKWQSVDEVLEMFGRRVGAARKAYQAYMAEGMRMGKRPEYAGGGLVRSAGGVGAALAMIRRPGGMKSDERILGSGEFVSEVLRRLEHRDRRRMALRRRMTPEEVVARAAKLAGVEAARVYARDRRKEVAKARFLACKWLVEDMGASVASVATLLNVTSPAVCHAVARGREVEDHEGVALR